MFFPPHGGLIIFGPSLLGQLGHPETRVMGYVFRHIDVVSLWIRSHLVQANYVR